MPRSGGDDDGWCSAARAGATYRDSRWMTCSIAFHRAVCISLASPCRESGLQKGAGGRSKDRFALPHDAAAGAFVTAPVPLLGRR